MTGSGGGRRRGTTISLALFGGVKERVWVKGWGGGWRTWGW